MNLEENNMKKIKEEAVQSLKDAKDKSEAIVDVVEKLTSSLFGEVKNQIFCDFELSKSDEDYKNRLGLRILNQEEKTFYQKLKNVRQSFTGSQDVLIPTNIINIALGNARTSSELLNNINIAPAGVQQWIIEEHSGTASWGKISDKITSELTSSLDGIKFDVHKLASYLMIPKSISQLGDEWVDRYFIEILTEALIIGCEDGVLNGDGLTSPIGAYNKIDVKTSTGASEAKTVNTNITDFSPKGLAPAKAYLTNNGKRVVDKILLICNPLDKANYVDPALYDQTGNMISSFKNLVVIETTANKQGKALFMLPKKYTFGFDKYSVDKYDQTKALEDADLLIGKVNANGRPNDDNVAYPFDVTKLQEFTYKVRDVGTVAGA